MPSRPALTRQRIGSYKSVLRVNHLLKLFVSAKFWLIGVAILATLVTTTLVSPKSIKADFSGTVSTPKPLTPAITPIPPTTGQVVIEPDNADKVVALTRWNKGAFWDAVWSPDGKWIALRGSIGIWLYSIDDLTKRGHLVEGHSYTVLDDAATEVGRLLEGYTANGRIAWSPDGKMLAFGSSDNTAFVLDVASGKLIQTLTGHTDHVGNVAFSPDGKILASLSWDRTVRLWDVASGKSLNTLTGHTASIIDIAFSPDGKLLASGSYDKTIRLWDVATGKNIKTLTDPTGDVTSFAFSPDGKILAEGNVDGRVRFWNVSSGTIRKTLTGHSHLVTSVAFSPDGKTLASTSADGSLLMWDIARGRTRPTSSRLARSAAFSPDGKTLAYTYNTEWGARLDLLDAVSGELLHVLQRETFSIVNNVAFSADGKTLRAITDGNPFQVWDIASGKSTNRVFLETSSTVAITADGKIYARVSLTQMDIELEDVVNRKELYRLYGDYRYIKVIAFSPDGKTLASGHIDDIVLLWDVASGKLIRTLTEPSSALVVWDVVYSLAFSPDGKTLATGSDSGKIRLWDVTSGKLIRTLTGHTNAVLSVAFSADGKLLASGSGEMMSPPSAKQDNTVRLWDVASGNMLHILAGHTDRVQSVAFNPDGKLLASGSQDNTIRLWDVDSGKSLNNLTGHTGAVLSVAFSPDGKTIASGSWDSTIRLWGIPSS